MAVIHKHVRQTWCDCWGWEPNERCPIHGQGEFSPRCCLCGQFIKWDLTVYEVGDKIKNGDTGGYYKATELYQNRQERKQK